MATCTTIETQENATVGMGKISAAREPVVLKAILGSCVGLALYHPRLKVGLLGHIVLPEAGDRPGSPGKFANTAVPFAIDALREMGVNTAGLVARIAGGANMFGTGGPLQIGDANIRATIEALKTAHIRVTGKELGGSAGRRVTLDCSTGEFRVEISGKPPVIL